MDLFLLPHVPQHLGLGAAAQHGELALVDAFRAILAGMVDADDARHRLAGGEVAGQAASGGSGHAALLRLARR